MSQDSRSSPEFTRMADCSAAEGHDPGALRQEATTQDEVRRLRAELQARNEELRESREYQAATGEILSVLSRPHATIEPVLDTIAETARTLCESYDALIMLRDGDVLRITSHKGPIPANFRNGR